MITTKKIRLRTITSIILVVQIIQAVTLILVTNAVEKEHDSIKKWVGIKIEANQLVDEDYHEETVKLWFDGFNREKADNELKKMKEQATLEGCTEFANNEKINVLNAGTLKIKYEKGTMMLYKNGTITCQPVDCPYVLCSKNPEEELIIN